MQSPMRLLFTWCCECDVATPWDEGLAAWGAPSVDVRGIVVLVVDEHAFYVDCQNRKQEYVNRFVQSVDWEAVDRHLRVMGA